MCVCVLRNSTAAAPRQVVLSGPWSNLTLFNIVMENLPYGDSASLREAEGNSIMLSNRLWPVRYKR